MSSEHDKALLKTALSSAKALRKSLEALVTDGSPYLGELALLQVDSADLILQRLTRWERLCASHLDPKDSDSPSPPVAAGKKWSVDEEAEMLRLWQTYLMSADSIAAELERTEGAIIARLVHLDIYPDRESAREEDERRRSAIALSRPIHSYMQ